MIMPVNNPQDDPRRGRSSRWESPADVRRGFESLGRRWRETNPVRFEDARKPRPLEALFFEYFKGDGERVFVEALHGEGALLCGAFQLPAQIYLNTYAIVRMFDALDNLLPDGPAMFAEAEEIRQRGADALEKFRASLREQNINLRDRLIALSRLEADSQETENEIIERAVNITIYKMELFIRGILEQAKMQPPRRSVVSLMIDPPSGTEPA